MARDEGLNADQGAIPDNNGSDVSGTNCVSSHKRFCTNRFTIDTYSQAEGTLR